MPAEKDKDPEGDALTQQLSQLELEAEAETEETNVPTGLREKRGDGMRYRMEACCRSRLRND